MSQTRNQIASQPRRFLWALLALCLCYLPQLAAQPTDATRTPTTQLMNPAAELWGAVRQREVPASGKTQVKGVDSGVLINVNGERWRQFRIQQLVPIGGYFLAGVVLLLILFYLVRGKIPVEGGLSQHKLPRYSSYERTLHWFIAGIFLFLGLSGLILLFGRPLLIPLMGKEAFSVLASASKEGHNLTGPLFLLALVLIFIRFVGRNIYQRGDLTWLLRGGGIIGKQHVPSNFFNMGEKTMFWLLVFVGGAIIVSGLVLLMPLFGQGREIMELAHVAHGIGAVLMIAVIIGHIYIGTVGMEGASEGIRTGYCDLNWAKRHHENWAEEAHARGEAVANEEVARLRGEIDRLPPGARIGEGGK